MSTDYPYKLNISSDAIIGRKTVFLDAVTSTNDEAKQLAAENAPSGTVVFAHDQTGGRGRLGRTWNAAAGEGISMSLLLCPGGIAPENISGITLVIGLACAEALNAQLKWPNDVLLNGKKIAGILAESVIEDSAVKYLIVGIGINVNNDFSGFPEEVKEKATSLFLESKKRVDSGRIAEKVLCMLDARIKEFISNGMTEKLLAAYKKKCVTLQKRVRATNGIEGIAVDITEDGELVIDLDSGERKIICSGEISIRAVDGKYI
jgi:BirA family biotin operon repressor/biotin-[acetyl-CoA-carboxylase] ligase